MPDETPLARSDVMTSEAPIETKTPKRRKPRRRAAIEWTIIIIVAILVSFLLRTFAFQTFYIPSGSMEPTLQIGDRIIVDKLAVTWGHINIGDIVVFKAPPSENCGEVVTDLVKRVIGLPGDHLTSKGNTIYVNGTALKENWPHNEPLGQAIGKVTVPQGQYFMMGDNHSDSCDSRMWGTVPRSDIIGKAFVRIWPLSRIGFL
ncbi:MAG TPA: signal peptidase I [Acidimicrobiales bacterium]